MLMHVSVYAYYMKHIVDTESRYLLRYRLDN